MVADDLHGQLVRADGTVGTEAPELAGGLAFGHHVEVFHFEGRVGHVSMMPTVKLSRGCSTARLSKTARTWAG